MKNLLSKTVFFTVFHYFTHSILTVLTLAVFTFCSYNTIYGKDKHAIKQRTSQSLELKNEINTNIEWVNLTGHSDEETDILEWEVLNISNIAYFTIECSKSETMDFYEVASINPTECLKLNNQAQFTYKFTNNDKKNIYYKIKVTYQDNHTIESNFILFKNEMYTKSLKNLEIIYQNGQIQLIFTSSKKQDITLNIMNRSGNLLIAKNITVFEGKNTLQYDASLLQTTEMLIFTLNNQEEQTTKKLIASSVW